MTPTEAMTEHKRRSPCCDDEAIRYLTSRNPDLAVFTVDSLAAALRAIPVPATYEEWQARVDASYEDDAAAIIQAAKEPERRCLRGDEEPQPLCHRHGMSPFIDDLGQCRAAREAERE